MTTVINLFGGPGCGKSTVAAELYSMLKRGNFTVELVREYIKDWAWQGKACGSYDQPYITAQQMHRESILYDKVDYIVTDSPFLLGAFYQEFVTTHTYMRDFLLAHMSFLNDHGVEFKNFLLTRDKPYVRKGRYETEGEAVGIDSELRKYLEIYLKDDITVIDVPDAPLFRAQHIFNAIDQRSCHI